MEEAMLKKFLSNLRPYFKFQKSKQSGQAIVEYILILTLALVFTRFVFFHQRYGFKGIIDHTMLKVGALLEKDLKAGAQPGGSGKSATDPWVGVSVWKN